MRVKILSRASSLARLQTALVERALRGAHPDLEIESLTRTSAGDQDQTSPLWKLPDKGAFTADLSQALIAGDADIVVHSFKDLPIEMPAGTHIAGALPRADARDVVLIKQPAIDPQPESLRILSSSPRRGWLLGEVLPSLLPWRTRSIEAVPVRGNIETRLRKLIEGEAHGLVVAKAALDRLLGFGPPFDGEAAAIREQLQHCRWMVMPMREFPWAPAQGAIAIEIASSRADLGAADRADRLHGDHERRWKRNVTCSKSPAADVTRRWARRLSTSRTDASSRFVHATPSRRSGNSSDRAGLSPRCGRSEVWPEPGGRSRRNGRNAERGAARERGWPVGGQGGSAAGADGP